MLAGVVQQGSIQALILKNKIKNNTSKRSQSDANMGEEMSLSALVTLGTKPYTALEIAMDVLLKGKSRFPRDKMLMLEH